MQPFAFKRRNVSATWREGASGESLASIPASFPPGGLYSNATVTSVPSSPGARSKRTEPAFGTSASGFERQAIKWGALSLMISARHVTFLSLNGALTDHSDAVWLSTTTSTG